MITKIAEILGVSEESIKTMPKDIFGSMQAVLANIEVKNCLLYTSDAADE